MNLDERSASPANRACERVVRGRKGYQQLNQDEEDYEDKEEKGRMEDKTRRSDVSKKESDDDDSEDGSSPRASGESDIGKCYLRNVCHLMCAYANIQEKAMGNLLTISFSVINFS